MKKHVFALAMLAVIVAAPVAQANTINVQEWPAASHRIEKGDSYLSIILYPASNKPQPSTVAITSTEESIVWYSVSWNGHKEEHDYSGLSLFLQFAPTKSAISVAVRTAPQCASVPVPPAFGLLTSALVGLAFISRRTLK